jgi:phenylacetate-CoA ligase
MEFFRMPVPRGPHIARPPSIPHDAFAAHDAQPRAHAAYAPAATPGDAFALAHRLTGWWMTLCDVWWRRSAGSPSVRAARDARLDQLLRHARAASPLYREAYRGLPDGVPALVDLPVMRKQGLMERFDEWVTDPAIRLTEVEAFLADRTRVGQRFHDRYIVWKSSGSTGTPGIYVQDDHALAAYDALIAIQLTFANLAAKCAAGLFKGGRAALVSATGDHFASTASWQRVCATTPGLAARGFSLLDPLDKVVAQLNDFAPAFLASYPTMLRVLADERRAGRLRVDPQLVWAGGECLCEGHQRALERDFGCPVVNEYGASECMSIAFGCAHGWLHVNADCVILEPVDAQYRPVKPGEASHTVLLTNLVNHVQPIIRYDLGDSIVLKPEPCACGNPLPAMRVQGRRDDVLTLATLGGESVRIVPLALGTVIEEATGVHRFQVVQVARDRLVLRFDLADAGQRNAAFQSAAKALRQWLAQQHVAPLRILFDERVPENDAASGKLRQVVVAMNQDDDARLTTAESATRHPLP